MIKIIDNLGRTHRILLGKISGYSEGNSNNDLFIIHNSFVESIIVIDEETRNKYLKQMDNYFRNEGIKQVFVNYNPCESDITSDKIDEQ